MADEKKDGVKKMMLEQLRVPSDLELDRIGEVYSNFYKWRNLRSGAMIQFQNRSLESVLKQSRELFWNSLITPSEDLREMDLDFSIPFARKEILNFVGKIVSQNIVPRFNGDNLDIYGIKVLQSIYNKWRFKTNDKVEKFWQVLYGMVNGTLPLYVGYNDAHATRRYLDSYDKKSGAYKIREEKEYIWDDVWEEIIPLEDIYFPKIYERNCQKWGRMIWKTEMDWKDFKMEFKSYDNAEYVYPGNQIAEDSLYFRLLDGSGVTAGERIQILKQFNVMKDEYDIVANGVWLNPVGKGNNQVASPMPFNHKLLPVVWSPQSPVDEKFAYGMPYPFLIKDLNKLSNVSITMLVERELRAIQPPVLSSDFDSPKLIYGRHDVIPVNDTNAYKEMTIQEPSAQFFTMMNTIKTEMSDQVNGGSTPVAPSKQPRSSREVLDYQQKQQEALGITLLMYYSTLRQETMLVLKTAMQFYTAKKYEKAERNIMRAITVPNMPLTSGGVGTLEFRIVKKTSDKLALFYESIHKALLNGRVTEIIEGTPKVVQNIEFEITSIDLEPEQSDQLKTALWTEQVLNPIMQYYVPSGLVDLGKVFLRHMEKMGEHPADFASDKVLNNLMSLWGRQSSFTMPPPQTGAQTGNIKQMNTGTVFGNQGNQGLPTQ